MICSDCYHRARWTGDPPLRALITAWRCTHRDPATIRRTQETRAALARLTTPSRR